MDARTENRTFVMFRRWGWLLILVPALAVTVAVGLMVRGIIVNGFGMQTVAGFATLVAESYGRTPLADGSEEQESTLGTLLENRIEAGRVVYAAVITPDGDLIYASDGGQVDAGALIAEADVPEPVARIVGSAEVPDAPSGTYLEIVGPLHMGPDQQPEGFVRVVRPYEEIAGAVRQSVATVSVTIMGGATLAYLLLAYLLGTATSAVEESRAAEERLSARLDSSMRDLEQHYLGTLKALSTAVDAKDAYTSRHSLNVADYACAIALRLGWEDECKVLERAGLLHDIGKIGIAEKILLKPDLLKPDEYEDVKRHSELGADIVSSIPFLIDVVPAVLHHHERWDGGGYPRGLAGDEIPLVARVLCVADAFDAMTTDRPYRAGLSVDEAMREIEANAGTQFDPKLAATLVELLREGELQMGR